MNQKNQHLTHPVVSVIMPTLNSAKTLEKVLAAVRAQDYPQEKIEIILADGGSTDGTLDIAKKYSCRIVRNERIQPECGKQVALQEATGKYAVFLDSDEVMLRNDAFSKKVSYLEGKVRVKNFTTAGLLNPPSYALINDYTNRYGDPFSTYMYGIDGGDYYGSLRRKYKVEYEGDGVLVVSFSDQDFLPIVDGGGHFFDREFLLSIADINNLEVIPNVFNLMVSKTRSLAVLSKDFIHHYSTVSFSGYVKKIRWRIISNLFYASNGAGFDAKQNFQPTWFKIKKFLFLPFGLTLVLPTLWGIYLVLRHKNPIYFLHGPLSFLTAVLIGYYAILKTVGIKPTQHAYGKS